MPKSYPYSARSGGCRTHRSPKTWFGAYRDVLSVEFVNRSNFLVGEPRVSLRQPRLPQTIRECREVLRAADREPIREIGDAQRGVEFAQMLHRAQGLVRPARERMARRNDADDHQEARQLPEGFLRPRRRGVEAPREQMRRRQSGLHAVELGVEWAQPDGVREVLDGGVRLAVPGPQESGEEPGRREIAIEH